MTGEHKPWCAGDHHGPCLGLNPPRAGYCAHPAPPATMCGLRIVDGECAAGHTTEPEVHEVQQQAGAPARPLEPKRGKR